MGYCTILWHQIGPKKEIRAMNIGPVRIHIAPAPALSPPDEQRLSTPSRCRISHEIVFWACQTILQSISVLGLTYIPPSAKLSDPRTLHLTQRLSLSISLTLWLANA